MILAGDFNHHRGLAAANFAKLPAADDRFHRGVDPIIVRFQLGLHFGQQRLVGKLHARPSE